MRAAIKTAFTYWAILPVVATITTLDLWSKAFMVAWLSSHNRIVEIAPFMNLRLGYNRGVSFGLFPATSDMERFALVAFALLAALLLIVLGLRARHAVERLAYASIAGGAIGNAADRAVDGFVTDFIDLHALGWHWPTFNLADVFITCGVVLLLLVMGNRPDTLEKA